MNRNEMDVKLVRRICLGNPEAMEFLANHWAPYCHEIDDLVDGQRAGAEALLATFARAAVLYTHPFFVKHAAALRQVALNVTSMYADSVAWETGGAIWQRSWADHHRHCSLEMVQAVAMICGGYEHARRMMPELRTMAWTEHHTERHLQHEAAAPPAQRNGEVKV